jgi:hypothetical protein
MRSPPDTHRVIDEAKAACERRELSSQTGPQHNIAD